MSYALVLIENKREGMKFPSDSVTHISKFLSLCDERQEGNFIWVLAAEQPRDPSTGRYSEYEDTLFDVRGFSNSTLGVFIQRKQKCKFEKIYAALYSMWHYWQ